MRNFRILIPVLVSAMAFAACSGGNGTSPTAGMPALGQNPVSADHIGKFSQGTLMVPPITEPDPCPGGLALTFGGSVHYSVSTVVGKTQTKITIHTAWHGLTATDSDGNAYTFKGVGNARVEIPNGGQEHGVAFGKIVAVGSGPDSGVRVRFRANVTINGDSIDVTLDSIKLTCD
jgi:hypothetical protein